MKKMMDRSRYPQYRVKIEKARDKVKNTQFIVDMRRKEVRERMEEQHRSNILTFLSYFRRRVHI